MNNLAQTWWVVNSRNYPAKDATKIISFLEGLDEKSAAQLMGIHVKSPIVGFLLTLFLGQLGAGRFYAGSKVRAILCLLLWIVGTVGWIMIIDGSAMREGALLMSALGFGVWMLLMDLYNIMGEIKYANLLKLSSVGFVDEAVFNHVRQDQLYYWIILLLLGCGSAYGANLLAETIREKEEHRRYCDRDLEAYHRAVRETRESYRRITQGL